MDFVVNDLSLSGQFPDLPSFQHALRRLMEIRVAILREGSSFYCHRNLLAARVTPQAVMQQAVQGMSKEQLSAWMLWLTKHGPYWEDERQHDGDSWLEVDGEIVTDTAVGEVAVCRALGIQRELVSFTPSEWLFTPVIVRWLREVTEETIHAPNHWELASVYQSLEANPVSIRSWKDLEIHMRRACEHLEFADDAFRPLAGCPFALGAAERIQVLLRTLNRFRECVDEEGRRNAQGNRLYDDHFTGDKAWFSDSSDTEKAEFGSALTFRHPDAEGEYLFCPWHGKVKQQQLRIHFTWPVASGVPLYVVYVGPKLTKR